METPSEQKIVVTGGAGFIGSQIAESFIPENDVVVVDTLFSGSAQNIPAEATFIQADVRNKEALEAAATDADIIFHEAALVSVTASVDDPETSHAINVNGTINVLEAARQHDTRVVLASSAAIYGPPNTVPITEDHPKQPGSPYGLDKLALDQYAQIYNKLYGLETVPLRYFNVYGPGQTGGEYAGVITVFIEQALSGDDITVHGDGEQTRDFIYVTDVVDALIQAMGKPSCVLNIGTGQPCTVNQLWQVIARHIVAAPRPQYAAGRTGDIRHSVFDPTRAEVTLGWRARHSLEEGLTAACRWYTSHG